MMEGMPRYARPAQSSLVEEAIEVLGNRARLAVVRYLLGSGPAPRGEIAAALGVSGATVYNQLRLLAQHGIAHTEPPEAIHSRGLRAQWVVDRDRLFDLYAAIGKEITFTALKDG
jgi:DNA-binding transcriptional ArsR family regulator